MENENNVTESTASTKVEEPKPEQKKARRVMKAKVEEKESKARYAPKGVITDPTKQRIKVLVKDNPKRAGTKCYTWFSWYRNGMTVKDYYEKGGRADHIRWDVAHGFISLS